MILIKSEILNGIVYNTYDNGIVESYEYIEPSEEPPIEEPPIEEVIPPDIPPTISDDDLKYLEYKLKEQDKKIFNLENENADLLLDAAIKDIEIESLKNDIGDLMLEVALMGGMR